MRFPANFQVKVLPDGGICSDTREDGTPMMVRKTMRNGADCHVCGGDCERERWVGRDPSNGRMYHVCDECLPRDAAATTLWDIV